MWGANWGEMIWGAGLAVPAFGPTGLIAMVLCFLAGGWVAQRRERGHWLAGALGVALVIAPLIAVATLPNTFTNGTIADADEVNANFAAVEALESRFGLVTSLASATTTSTAWTDVPDRSVILDKSSSTSVLLVTYQSTRRADGGSSSPCDWILTVGGVQFDGYASYWDTEWSTGVHSFIVQGVAAGMHTVALQWRTRNIPGQACQDFGSAGLFEGFFLVEERGI